MIPKIVCLVVIGLIVSVTAAVPGSSEKEMAAVVSGDPKCKSDEITKESIIEWT